MRTGLRARVGLVVEAGDAIEQHHMATLFGYGAEAVYPWLAMETVATLFAEAHGRADNDTERPGPALAQSRYRTAVEKGLLKVLAKMGISTLASYCGAQTFDALGLGADVIDRCFAGTASPLGGLTLRELSEDALLRHRRAYTTDGTALTALPDYGRVRFRKDGEAHAWAPRRAQALQQAVGSARRAGVDPDEAWRTFARNTEQTTPSSVRDLLTLRPGQSISLEEVEPMEAIRARFIASAMSLGALSPEAHETITIAMNRIQARSNSGEGARMPQRTQIPIPRATVATAASSRWHRHGSASRRSISRVPMNWRSRSCRAPSPAKADSSPATRSPNSLPACDTAHRVWDSSPHRRITTSTASKTSRSSCTISRP